VVSANNVLGDPTGRRRGAAYGRKTNRVPCFKNTPQVVVGQVGVGGLKDDALEVVGLQDPPNQSDVFVDQPRNKTSALQHRLMIYVGRWFINDIIGRRLVGWRGGVGR